MKTVMKKMFCLMLVAVLMVGALPFAASADAVPYYQVILSSDNSQIACEGLEVGVSYSISSFIGSGYAYDFGQHKHADGSITELSDPFQVVEGDVIVIAVSPAAADPCAGGHTAGADATCTTAQTCTVCGTTLKDAKGHTAGAAATCTTAQTCTVCNAELTPALGHDVVDGKCTRCTCKTCGKPLTADHVCDTVLCPTCKDSYTEGTIHSCAKLTCEACKETYTKGTSHTAGCPYCAVCLAKGDKVATHATADHCTTCDTANGHKSGYPCYTAPATGNVNLYVWANLFTGDTKKQTILLDTITGLSGNELVYQVVSNNEGRIRSKIPAGYGWTGHVYYEQDPKTVLDVHSKLTVGAEDDVVLNLYSDQKLVVARVHTGKTYAIDRTINIDGFKVGNTVTSNDVLKAVQKYYNVSTMKMYTPAEWEKVVNGGSGTVIPNYEVHGGDNIIDVYVTGSYKTTSGTTHKADSSNPKTGDEIFVPMTVLFASVSSLAVLLYLNKKRAF